MQNKFLVREKDSGELQPVPTEPKMDVNLNLATTLFTTHILVSENLEANSRVQKYHLWKVFRF